MKISSDNAPGKMQEASVIENDLDFSVGWSSSRIAEQGVNHLGGDGTSLLGDFTDGASTLRTFPINIQDNDGDGAADENDPPLPFTPDPNDEFVRPKPGQLVSYLWKARDVEADTDAAYRVGVVLDKAGKCRFFQDFDDTYEEYWQKGDQITERTPDGLSIESLSPLKNPDEIRHRQSAGIAVFRHLDHRE